MLPSTVRRLAICATFARRAPTFARTLSTRETIRATKPWNRLVRRAPEGFAGRIRKSSPEKTASAEPTIGPIDFVVGVVGGTVGMLAVTAIAGTTAFVVVAPAIMVWDWIRS